VTRGLAPWLAGIALYSAGVAFVIRWFSLQPVAWEAEAAVVNALIVGLLLAFRNRVDYERWWEGRCLWGQLINETRNLAWKVKAYLPTEAIARCRVPEALVGFAVALKRHLRSGVRLQEIAGFEKDPAHPVHVPSHLAGQILITLIAWQRDGLIDGNAVRVLDPHARALLDVCGGCERIQNTGFCPTHKVLLWLGIAVSVLVGPWYTLAELGYWGIPIVLLVCYFLLGIERLDAIIEEPFGTDPDDLDLDRYCQTILESVRAILNEDQN
jgi:putative membrane protein